MATCGGINAFSGEAADWKSYIERLENYFVVQGITEAAKQREMLLSECGAATYKLV